MLKNYTTKISAYKTIGEITGILAEHGARRISQDYDGNGKIVAVCFEIDTPFGLQAVRLPANVEKVLKVLQKQKVPADYERAEMVAWRIVKDWIDAQMAILESDMVEMSEIFFPYMLNNVETGETVYQLFKSKQLRLGDGTANG